MCPYTHCSPAPTHMREVSGMGGGSKAGLITQELINDILYLFSQKRKLYGDITYCKLATHVRKK